jgi:hypothetical protein
VTIDYFPERGNRIGVETKTYPVRGVVVAPDHLGLSIMGERGAIDRDYPDTRLIPALRAEPATIARTLVELQIKATPDKVGPPVSVLEFTSEGHRWRAKGACR